MRVNDRARMRPVARGRSPPHGVEPRAVNVDMKESDVRTTGYRGAAVAVIALVGGLLTAPSFASEEPSGAAPDGEAIEINPGGVLKGLSLAEAEPVAVESRDEALAKEMGEWFAGTYKDEDGVVVVRSTTNEVTAEGFRQLQPVLERSAIEGVQARREAVHVEPAEYSFRELLEIKKSVEGDFLSLPGSVYTDLDEVENKVVLGYDPKVTTAKTAAAASVSRAKVDTAAVEFRPAEPVQEESLRARSSSLIGGLQLGRDAGVPGEITVCSLGLPVLYSSSTFTSTGFLTNDHCTWESGAVGGFDDPWFHQPAPLGTTWQAGYESIDPALFTGGVCPAGRECRRSDAAFFASGSSISTSPGVIARMDAANDYTAWSGDASPVTSTGVPFVGDSLMKIGRTTGQTSGTVTQTCINTNAANTNITRICQDRASYNSAGGDSGGPVVANDLDSPVVPTPYRFYGIHWGSNGVFSWIGWAVNEIGGTTGTLAFVWG